MSTDKELLIEYKKRAKLGNFYIVGNLAKEFNVSRSAIYKGLARLEARGELVEELEDF